jgi:hypothetical protein
MEQLSQADIDKLLSEWLTQKEISSLQRSIDDINAWRVYSQEEMEAYVEKNIFAKYRNINV